MIRHIVFWNLKEENKAATAQKIKTDLENLSGKISGLLHIEVGTNSTEAPQDNWDVVLHCDFENIDALNAYQVHPLHKEVAEFIGSVRTARACIDYEI